MTQNDKDIQESSATRAKAHAIIGGRDEQQDSFLVISAVDTQTGIAGELLVLADGMGGHSGGQEASACAVEAFAAEFSSKRSSLEQRLSAALDAANDAIADQVAHKPQLKGMGCTLIGAFVASGKATWISVGDSPLYLQDDEKLQRINEDHSLAPKIDKEVELGKRSAESARNDPARHALLSALTGRKIPIIDRGTTQLPLGSKFLLASDGLDTLEPSAVFQILNSSKTAENAVSALLDSLAKIMPPDQDNTTVIVFHRDELEPVPAVESTATGWPLIIFGLVCFTLAIASITVLFLIGDGGDTQTEGTQTTIVEGAGDAQPGTADDPSLQSPETTSQNNPLDENEPLEIPIDAIQQYDGTLRGDQRPPAAQSTQQRERAGRSNRSPSRARQEERTTVPKAADQVTPDEADTPDLPTQATPPEQTTETPPAGPAPVEPAPETSEEGGEPEINGPPS